MSTETKSSSRPARPDEKKRLRAGQIQDKGNRSGRGASSRDDGPIGAAPPAGTAISGAAAILPDPQT